MISLNQLFEKFQLLKVVWESKKFGMFFHKNENCETRKCDCGKI